MDERRRGCDRTGVRVVPHTAGAHSRRAVVITTAVLIAAVALAVPWRPMRWLVAVGVALVSGYAVYDLATALPAVIEIDSLSGALLVADAIASTTLTAWLGARAVWILVDRARDPSHVTPRIVGIFTIAVASAHLALIPAWDPGISAGLELNLSPTGIILIGFTGWQVWHGALALAGLGLAIAPRRMARHFALLLVLLVVYIIPTSLAGAMVMWQMTALLAIPLYMTIWLRVELGRRA